MFNNEECKSYKSKAEWMKNHPKKDVPFAKSGSDENCYFLEYSNAEKQYEGEYKLILSNEHNKKATTQAILKVKKESPVFIEELKNVETNEDRKVSYRCEISDPEQKVFWTLDELASGKKISLDIFTKDFKIDSDEGVHTLKFLAKKNLEGTFSCKMDKKDFANWGIDPKDLKITSFGKKSKKVKNYN